MSETRLFCEGKSATVSPKFEIYITQTIAAVNIGLLLNSQRSLDNVNIFTVKKGRLLWADKIARKNGTLQEAMNQTYH